MITFETERLYLRPWEMTDVDRLYELAKDEQVGPACGWKPHESVEESAAVLQNVLMDGSTYAILLKDSHEIIGCISYIIGKDSRFCENENQCEMGFWLGRSYWGNGYLPEACKHLMQNGFEHMGIEKIWCAYFEGNEKSKRAQEKLGFRYQGTYQTKTLMGEEKIGIFNCITKEEWEN